MESFGNLVRSDFWFEDGNLILIAGSAAFKVHRGQLARHSEFFNDLISLPQPQSQPDGDFPQQQLIDGCFWVELHDCPSDVFYFLKALYDGLYFKPTQASTDFPLLFAVLRMSTKYLVEHLRQRCLARLDRDWPSTLAGWDRREQAATDELGRYMPRLGCAHPVLVVQLALEQGLPSVLCAAMYDLSRYGPSRIKIGTVVPSEVAGCEALVASLLGEGKQRGEKEMVALSREYLYRTFQGREHAQKYMASFIEKELEHRKPSPECTYRFDAVYPSRPCLDSFYFIMLNVLRAVGGIAAGRDADPLFTLGQAGEMLTRMDFSEDGGRGRGRQCGLGMCVECRKEFEAVVRRARQEVWSLLPRWFGLQ
ncbi:hypothetical protein AMATHDRAFT_159844 [Amanita thiersii Skay4041]|uniref:BTB domain-containing protein n=1 Tax=Amanita thiersii Skay4041 TaxID=703135 RepID=A0A2A9NB06_9AGAR|nr:hypothetical protein AMATHDRAFT_159844 [Amanita thiersii Skay4041]